MKKLLKKILPVGMALMMAFGFTATVSAADYVPSIENKGGPSVEDGDVELIPYKDKSSLTPEIQKEMEDALEKIKEGKLPEELGDAKEKITVTDIFYISEKEGESGPVTIKYDVKPGQKVYMLVYEDGAWKLIECTDNGNGTITFNPGKSGIYAIAVYDVNESAAATSPQTGIEANNSRMVIGVVIVLAACVIVLSNIIVAKKKRAR